MKFQLFAILSALEIQLLLVSAFAILAAALAAIGLFGVVAYLVARRTREIGIRIALGALPGQILRDVVREGALLAGIGIAVGVVAATALTRLLGGLVYGVEVLDPLTFVGVTALLAAVALVATYLPARRAARVDPLIALRHE
ncbi:MAG: FtsX-like permease family protein [Gemmatimonas sp.]|nr:FtsX-like permease family protein [Gemmatimonas sp.]